MTRTLHQIRAASAIDYIQNARNLKGKNAGDFLRGLPALIISNGMLATLAYALDKKEETGHRECFKFMSRHLQSEDIGLISPANGQSDEVHLLRQLTSNDSRLLKLVTAESLAWLEFARRFSRDSESLRNPAPQPTSAP